MKHLSYIVSVENIYNFENKKLLLNIIDICNF